jgi:hypothetical protein
MTEAIPTPSPRQAPLDQSPTIGQLAAALAKAQGQMSTAKKDSANPFFKSSYADLAACWEACRTPLSSNGLAIIQTTRHTQTGDVQVISTLAHAESGEWIKGVLTIKPVKADPQGIGSALTYARRYALCAMVGIAPDDDDDGEAAMGRPQTTPAPPRQQQPPRQAQGGDMASEAQCRAIHSICTKKQLDAHGTASQILGREVSTLKSISKQEAGKIIDLLNQK